MDAGLAKGAGGGWWRVVGDHVAEGDAGTQGGDADDGAEEAVEEGADAFAAVAGHGLDATKGVSLFAWSETGGVVCWVMVEALGCCRVTVPGSGETVGQFGGMLHAR